MIPKFPPIIIISLVIMVGYFLAIIGPIIGVKYRLPIEPILTIFATYFIIKFRENKKKMLTFIVIYFDFF
jgi:hypothetical protein